MKWSGWGSEVLWPCWKKSIWRTEEKIPGAERNSEDPWSWFGFVQKHCTWVKSVLCSYFSSCWTPGILLCLQITSVIASFSFKPFGLVFQIGIMYIISDAIPIMWSNCFLNNIPMIWLLVQFTIASLSPLFIHSDFSSYWYCYYLWCLSIDRDFSYLLILSKIKMKTL